MRWMLLIALALAQVACASIDEHPESASQGLRLVGEMIHACECDPYCPCPFRKDATYSECRSLTVWMIEEGADGPTELDGLTFAVSMTRAGKNVARARGTWEGILLLPEQATEEQQNALSAFFRREHGDGFSRLDVRTLPTTVRRGQEGFDLSMEGVLELRVRAIPGADGTVTRIEDPPSHPMGMGTLLCGVTEVHSYNDGAMRWDFSGRNAYFGPFAEGE